MHRGDAAPAGRFFTCGSFLGCDIIVVVVVVFPRKFSRSRRRVGRCSNYSLIFHLLIELEIKSGTKVKKLQRQFFCIFFAYFCIEKQKNNLTLRSHE